MSPVQQLQTACDGLSKKSWIKRRDGKLSSRYASFLLLFTLLNAKNKRISEVHMEITVSVDTAFSPSFVCSIGKTRGLEKQNFSV